MVGMGKKLIDILYEAIQENQISDVFVDCGQGDKFIVEDVNVDKNRNSLSLLINNHSLKWIEIDGKHPIVLTSDKSPK